MVFFTTSARIDNVPRGRPPRLLLGAAGVTWPEVGLGQASLKWAGADYGISNDGSLEMELGSWEAYMRR